MKIEVTEDDIRMGRPKSACACPIALALKRAGIKGDVAENLVCVKRSIYQLPAVASDFIRRFDLEPMDCARVALPPFSFDIDIPTP